MSEPPSSSRPAAPADRPLDGARNANPAGIGFWALVAEDYATHGRDPLSQGFWAPFWHQFGNWPMSVRPRFLRLPLTLLYQIMTKLGEWMAGIFPANTVIVGRRVRIEPFGRMIPVESRIGDDVIIRQNTAFGIATLDNLQGRPDIGDRVEIGAGAALIGRTTIGPDTIIGANAVMTKSVPPGVVAGGEPARILRNRGIRLADA